MPEVTMSAAPLVIGATGLLAIRQNIRIIVLTAAYSVPLDRGFANTCGFVDAPSPLIAARATALLTEAIEKNEPRVTVRGIEFTAVSADAADQGRLVPRVIFDLKPGVVL